MILKNAISKDIVSIVRRNKQMTEQKQIEEIKAVLVRTCKRVRTMQEDHMQDRYAEALYNAGYHKQIEGVGLKSSASSA